MKTILFSMFVISSIVTNAQPVFDKSQVKIMMDKVNKYQLEHPWTEFDNNWIRGTYYSGVMACYLATKDDNYLDQCNSFCASIKWKLPALPPDHQSSGVNLLTCGQTMLESYMEEKENYKIEGIITHLEDPEIKNPVSNPIQWYFEGGRRYVDGLFTGPPTLAMLYSVTGDDKYLQWMEACVWDIYGKLFDIDENLFYRDHRFFPDCMEERRNDPDWDGNNQVTVSGKKVIWSRGNGWAFAGLARILKYLPENHSNYARYRQVFMNMAHAIIKCQSDDGFWYPNLADPDDIPLKESSGTCFFIYGLAYGINTGILDRDMYLPVVEKAWKSVCGVVSEEGKVQWGQKVGDRPVMLQEEDSHEYVSGTFLLAASEIYKLK